MAAKASTIKGVIISSPSSTTLLIAVQRVSWRIISNRAQFCIQKWISEQNHAPFRGDLSSLWQDLI